MRLRTTLLYMTPSLETDMQFCVMLPRFSLRHGRVLAPDQPTCPEASGEVLSCLYYIGCHECSLKSHSGPFLPTYPSAYSNVSERPTQWVSPLKGPTPPHPPSCTHTLSAQDLVGQKGQRELTGHWPLLIFNGNSLP